MRRNLHIRLSVENLESRETPAVFYVDPTGSDLNSGSEAAPLLTLQTAANRVAAGDTVFVCAGTYRGFNATVSGTAAARITFAAKPTAAAGSVVINQPNPWNNRDGINLELASFVTVRGFTVTGQPRAGIRSVENQFVEIRDNTVDSNTVWGIFTAFSDDLLIENNRASRSAQQHGIYVSNSGDRPVIRGNTVFENYASGIQLNADVSQGGDGIISNAVIENNVIRANGAGGGGSINLDGVQDSDIRNNLIDNARASGIALFQQDGATGSTNNRIVNNTIVVDNSLNVSHGRWGVTITGGSTGTVLRNNIVFSTQEFAGSIELAADSRAGLISDYNAVENRFWYGGEAGLTGWQTATGQDLHSVSLPDANALNSLFANRAAGNYHLSPTSAAIDRGTANGAPSTDFEGHARPSGASYDIGADEFQSGSTPPAPGASAAYAGSDAATRGSWRGAYGADGYALAQGASSPPPYGAATLAGQSDYTWAGSTADARALQKPAPAGDRLAGTWYSASSFSVDVAVGPAPRRVSLYFLDWDGNGSRAQRVDVLDAATGAVLDTRVVSGFQNGTYLSWTLTGNVRFRIAKTAGSNAVLSGLFFGGAPAAPAPGASAAYAGSDAATRGSWRGAYGADGYALAQGASSPPPYGAATLAGQSDYTWAGSTADARALQKPAPAGDRLAGTWYSASSFSVDVAVGPAPRRVSLYFLDWDGNGSRAQRVDVLDAATGAVLDTRVVSGFQNGTYLSWTLTGNVRFRIAKTAGSNAVLSGLFFG